MGRGSPAKVEWPFAKGPVPWNVLQTMDRVIESRGRLAVWVDGLQARGRYTFRREDAAAAGWRSGPALKKALARLVQRGRIVMPRRGFFVIVPAEHALAGGPPASWFIDDLMAFLGRPYYVALLTAAALHGAGHQQPQVFQVMTDAPVRPVIVGRVRVRFSKRVGLVWVPTVQMKTPTGTMRVSTPEATALDLVRFFKSAGHLDHVATVLAELGEHLDGSRLVEVARETGIEIAAVQRLGFLLEKVKRRDVAKPLAAWVRANKPLSARLLPGQGVAEAPESSRWRLLVNAEIEPDL